MNYQGWRNPNRTYLKDVVPLSTPYNLYVETSSVCNFRCIYCGHDKYAKENPTGNMSKEIFSKIVEQCKAFPKKLKLMDMFWYGEPLCNPKLADMIAEAKSADIAECIGFTTNGVLLNKEIINRLIVSGVDVIRISLQGLDVEKYESTCGCKIDVDKFRDNLKYLYDHRGQCKVKIKIADISLRDMKNGEERFYDMFGGICDAIFVEHILPMYKDIDYEAINSNIVENKINGRYGYQQNKVNKVCYRPFMKMAVRFDGTVTAACCDMSHEVVFGNIRDHTLNDIWNGESHRNFLRMQLQGKRFLHEICKNCCIPNDLSFKEDYLDPYADELLKRF